MKTGRIIQDDTDIRRILAELNTVAVVGLSSKPDRISHNVAAYLKNNGYHIIPVRPPGGEKILGETAAATLVDIETPVDIVDVFRASDKVYPHAEEALEIGPRVFWMQLGIRDETAAALLTSAGIDVVMDKCMKAEHARLFSG